MKKNLCFFSLIFIFLNFVSLNAANLYEEKLQSDAAIMVNLENKQIVLEKNIDKKRSPASLTKIMTFIVTLENVKNPESEYVTVNKNVFSEMLKDEPDSSLSNLRDGDHLSILQLLYCMMVASGNDAALVLADYVSGRDLEKFIDLMNKKALDIGCSNTHFTNPHGLYDENHYSSAMDIYLMSEYALDMPYFKKIVSTVEYDAFKDGRPKLINTNKLINPNSGEKYYCKYAKGIKTGQHDQAGRCLASYAENDSTKYVCVVLGAPKEDSFGEKTEDNLAVIESKNLYNWAFNDLKLVNISNSRNPISEVDLKLAWKKDKLLLYPEMDVSVFLPKSTNKDEIEMHFDLPEYVSAKIHKNQVIGSASFFYKGFCLSDVNLVSHEDIKKNMIMVIINFLSSRPFLIGFWTTILIMLAYILATIFKNFRKKKTKKSSIKKYRKY